MACEPYSAWTTVVRVSAAMLSPVVAVAAGWIAWQQVRINRNNLKLDRFDRRFEIYEATMSFVATICSNGGVQDEWMDDFSLKTRGARFLVSEGIADYLAEIRKKSGQLQSVKLQMAVFGGTPMLDEGRRNELGDEWGKAQTWFQEQLKVIPEKFAPFLSVAEI